MLNKKALAGTPSTPPVFVEDVFSTYLYSGSSSDITVNNGIDLAGKGGLIWLKERNNQVGGDPNHYLTDSGNSFTKSLYANTTNAAISYSIARSVSSTGYVDKSGFPTSSNMVSWTFRKAKKFFDVVTYTGNGTTDRNVPHNLGSQPGMVIIKAINDTSDWNVRHVALGSSTIKLNTTAAAQNIFNPYNTDMTSTTFYATTISNPSYTSYATNNSGVTYVAYLFAHNAGGFGTAGTDNVISCGSFTGSSLTTVTLGYEPQYVMLKYISADEEWIVADVMRGMSLTTDKYLAPNSSNAEATYDFIEPTATGFRVKGLNTSGTYIYMAIRRPMKVPTTGTSVFSAVSRTGTSANATVSASISPVDMVLETCRNANFGTAPNVFDRLRGANRLLITSTTGAEVDTTSTPTLTGFDVQDGYKLGDDSGGYGVNYSPYIFINWNFKRAAGFFDVVCYTGTGSATTQAHNLGVVPELMIVKRRSSSGSDWWVYNAPRGATKSLRFTDEAEFTLLNIWNNTAPTSSVFTVGADSSVNGGSSTYVAYLFATCAGVSKVGSYTGNGSSQTINCSFTAGARFVLIKRTDSTGDWYVYDTARGIVSGNDPQLKLNSTAAEATGYDAIDPDNSGFIVNNDATNFPINVNNATYIFYAVA